MKKILALFWSSFFVFSLTTCDMSNVGAKKDNLDIEEISTSRVFKVFKTNVENFSEPYLQRLQNMDSQQIQHIYKLAERVSAKSKADINSDDYLELVKEMGYSGIEDYELKSTDYLKSLRSFVEEYPEIKELSEKDRKQLLAELFSVNITTKQKAGLDKVSNCIYDYSYCMSMAKGKYYIAVSNCSWGLLGGPIGSIGALGCAVGVTVIYEGAKQECVHNYQTCNER